MIYTSYFAKLKKFPENFQPIAICQFPPKWYTGPSIKIFAPNSDILINKDSDILELCELLNSDKSFQVFLHLILVA